MRKKGFSFPFFSFRLFYLCDVSLAALTVGTSVNYRTLSTVLFTFNPGDVALGLVCLARKENGDKRGSMLKFLNE